MNYSKPEVATLGDAVELIESLASKIGRGPDNLTVPPAYDLDE